MSVRTPARERARMKIALIVVVSFVATFAALAIFSLVARFLLLRWVRGRILAAIERGEGSQTGIAPSVHFEPIEAEARWQQGATPSVVERFVALGYVSAGRFRVPELAGMEVVFATHPDGTAVAVYDHAMLPTFFDVVRTAQDETSAYVTSTPLHDPGHTPPGVVVIADDALTPEEAVDLLRGLRPTGELLPATAENVCALAAAAYERQMAHILTASAPTGEQMLAVGERYAAATGTQAVEIDDDGLRLAAGIHRIERERALTGMIVQTFLRTSGMDAEEWERLRDRVVVIHERMSLEERDGLLPDPAAAKVLGEVDHPIRATLYRLPG